MLKKGQRKKILYVCMAVILCTGCGGRKDTNSSDLSDNSSGIKSETENETEMILTEEGNKTNKVPAIPRNEKEYYEKFGKRDQSGKWIPPENSYTDPKTGAIYNEDGVRIGGREEAPHEARPGSKG